MENERFWFQLECQVWVYTHTHTHTHTQGITTMWKSDLSDKIKWKLYQVVAMLVQLYGYTTLTLRKQLEKKLFGNYTRMLPAVLNKFWKQHVTKQLYSHLPLIIQTNQWQNMQGTTEEIRTKWCSPMDSNTWTHQYWLTNKNFHLSALCESWMWSRVMADSDGW